MNLLKNAIMIFLLFISISCDNSTEPKEENNKPENYIHLQNQTDHSGVLIKLIENNVMVITDSLGLFILPKVADGEYTLQAKYPFFEIIEKRIIVTDSVLKTEMQIELKQQLQFWVEPAETTVTLAEKTNFLEFRGYVENISDSIVSGTTYTLPNNWGIIPESINWNIDGNTMLDSERCYEENWNIGLTDLTAVGGYSIQPEKIVEVINKEVWQLGYECTPPGRTYLLFFSLVDEKYFDEYFQSSFFIDGKVDSSQIINLLQESFFKKRELFRPAIINFTN